MARADSLQTPLHTFPEVSLDSMYTWLIYPRDTVMPVKSSGRSDPFFPPLPARTWAEKQYNPLPPPPSSAPARLSNAILLVFLIVATLLAVLIRLRFWKYYNDFIKVLFHPRSVFRMGLPSLLRGFFGLLFLPLRGGLWGDAPLGTAAGGRKPLAAIRLRPPSSLATLSGGGLLGTFCLAAVDVCLFLLRSSTLCADNALCVSTVMLNVRLLSL